MSITFYCSTVPSDRHLQRSVNLGLHSPVGSLWLYVYTHNYFHWPYFLKMYLIYILQLNIFLYMHYHIYLNVLYTNVSIQFTVIKYLSAWWQLHLTPKYWTHPFICNTCLSTWLIMWNVLYPFDFVVIFLYLSHRMLNMKYLCLLRSLKYAPQHLK